MITYWTITQCGVSYVMAVTWSMVVILKLWHHMGYIICWCYHHMILSSVVFNSCISCWMVLSFISEIINFANCCNKFLSFEEINQMFHELKWWCYYGMMSKVIWNKHIFTHPIDATHHQNVYRHLIFSFFYLLMSSHSFKH